MDSVVLFEIEGSVIHQIVQNIVRHHWQAWAVVYLNCHQIMHWAFLVVGVVNSEGVVAMVINDINLQIDPGGYKN